MLEGDPGEGGVFDAVVEGEWLVERDWEVLRGKRMSGFWVAAFGAEPFIARLNGLACIAATLLELDRRNRFLSVFEAERLGGSGGIVIFSAGTGGALYDEGDSCIFVAEGVEGLVNIRGFMGEALDCETALW